MQKRPTNQSTDVNMQYVPATSVATSIVSPITFSSFMNAALPASITRKYRRGRDVLLRLFLLGICLEGLYLALFPLLAGNDPAHDPLFHAWHTFLPWIPLLLWTGRLPTQLRLHLAWFDPSTLVGNANWLLVALGLILLVVLLAAQIGRLRCRRSRRGRSAYAWLILLFAMLFALTMLVSPPHLDIFSRDMVLSWFAGRMVVIYHVNPYIACSNSIFSGHGNSFAGPLFL